MVAVARFFRQGLNLRHLRLLMALDDYRTVRRAAVALNITQPAVSKTLAQIEQDMKVRLFERTRSGLAPTDHGEAMIVAAREVLDSLTRAERSLSSIDGGLVGHVSLGVLPATAVHLMPRFVARLEGESRAITVSIREGTMRDLVPSLRLGEVNLVVGALPERPLGPEFTTDVLMTDPIVAVVRRGHAHDGRTGLDWADIEGFPLVLPPPNTFTRGAIDAIFERRGIRIPRSHVDSVSTMTNVGTLHLTDSIGFLSRALARHFVGLGLLSILDLPIPGVALQVGLVRMTEHRLTQAQSLAVELLRSLRDEIVGDEEPT